MPLTIEELRIKVTEENTGAYDRLDDSQRKLQKTTGTTDTKVKGLSSTLLNMGAAAGVAMASAVALRGAMTALAKPAGLAINFEKEFALVRTLSKDVGKDLERELLELAGRVPQTAGDITRAAYNAISAGIKPVDVTAFLDSASKAAVAGNADLTTVVSTLTTAVNAFGDQGIDAARAADILFGTVKAGVTDFGSLAAALPQGASLGKLGVSFEELNASAAHLTKTLGVPTAEAFTRVSALVSGLTAAGGPMQKRLKAMGVDVSIATLKQDGLAKTLARVQKATGGNVEVFGALSRRSEATQALVGLLGDSFGKFQETLDRVTNSSGETSAAFGIMQDTTQGAIDQLSAMSEGVLRDIGNQALPLVNQAIERFSHLMETRGPDVVDGFASMAGAVASVAAEIAGAIATTVEFFDLVTGARGERAAKSIAGTANESFISGAAARGEAFISEKERELEAQRDAALARANAAGERARQLTSSGPHEQLVAAAEERDSAKQDVSEYIRLLRLLGAARVRIAADVASDHAEQIGKSAGEWFRSSTGGAVDALRAAVADAASVWEGAGGLVPVVVSPKVPPVVPPKVPPRPGPSAAVTAEREFEKRAEAEVFAESALIGRQMAEDRARREAQESLDRDLSERRIALVEDEGARKLAQRAAQHQAEMAQAIEQGLEVDALREQQAAEFMSDITEINEQRRRQAEETAAAEAAAYDSSIAANISALSSLAGALEGAGVIGSEFRAVLLGVEGVYHAFKAVSEGAEAASAYAAGAVPIGLAHTAAGIQHAAASVKAFSDAAKLGKGGGKKGGGGGSSASAARATPSSDVNSRPDVPRRGGDLGGVTNLTLVLSDLVLPPDPASLERAVPALAEAFERANLTRGFGGLPGASAFADD